MPAEANPSKTEENSPPPSAGFLATMKLVTSGERNPRALQAAGLEHVEEHEATGADAPPKPAAGTVVEPPTPTPTPEPTPEPEKRKAPAKPAPGAPAGQEPTPKPAPGDETGAPELTPEPEKRKGKRKAKLSREDLAKAAADGEGEGEGTPASEGAEPTPKGDEGLRGVQPTDPASFQKRIRHYEGLLSNEQSARKTADAELTRLRTENAELAKRTQAIPEDIDEQLKQLKIFRRRYDLQSDPEIKEKFVSKLEASNQAVAATLKSAEVPNWYIEAVAKHGSLSQFLRSKQSFKIKSKDGKGTEDVQPAELHKRVLDMLDDADRELVQSELVEQRRISREREQFEKKSLEEVDAYFQKLDQESVASREEQAKRTKAIDDGVQRFKADVLQEEWLKDVETPSDASSEVKKANAATNKFRAEMRQFFEQQLGFTLVRKAAELAQAPEELNELGQMIVDSARVYHVERELNIANRKVKALEKELEEMKTAGSTTTTGSRIVKAPLKGGSEVEKLAGESELAYAIRVNRLRSQQGV